MGRRNNAIICRVKAYRQARGWSQEELATRMGLRRQAIYDIESGRYLPNTAVALRLAREFACRVEDLFCEDSPVHSDPIQLFHGGRPPSSPRLALARVRGRLVGVPLEGRGALTYGFHTADGLLDPSQSNARLLCAPERLEKTVLLLGCDPAFEILGQHVARSASFGQVHCRFASSVMALNGLSEGMCHLAGTHLHNMDHNESNVVMAGQLLKGFGGHVLGFSLLEEGFMVAEGNPKAVRGVADLTRSDVRLVNRETGAALRVLLDDHLQRAGIPSASVNGYGMEVASHQEGAYRVGCHVADAALGLRAIAEAFGLGFVPLAVARCDLVIPNDMLNHPTIQVVLDVLQSKVLRGELNAIPGYDASVTGKRIATI